MNREQYKVLRIAALESLKSDIEQYQRLPQLDPQMRAELHRGHQAIIQKLYEWQQEGTWTDEDENRFLKYSKRLN